MTVDLITSPHIPDNHPNILKEKVGVLLLNLGTPNGTDFWSIRRYLKEFLSDPRVIEVNRVLWSVILNLIILNVRPKISAKAYKEIWLETADESPLRFHTREQSESLSQRFKESGVPVEIDWAMRYGTPAIGDRLEEMRAKGCRKILLLALYPQYSATTTASAYDKAFQALQKMRWQPVIRTSPAYYNNKNYIRILAKSINEHIALLDWEPDVLLTSFHGLPRRYLDAGDPYHCECAQTSRLLAEEIGWTGDRVRLAFQSRFGREEWLKPYIQEVITELPSQGIKKIAIISPGFISDCVETLEEVAIGLKESFVEAGGEKFTYVPCLNSSEDSIDLLQELVLNELSGWIPE